ncbi:MAG: RNA degradosome polyphosphate kinase [Lachnospiraceae bacterium]|nr:RNA degradosome polyphosphate kinase [Lachnospiraceae bacterium]
MDSSKNKPVKASKTSKATSGTKTVKTNKAAKTDKALKPEKDLRAANKAVNLEDSKYYYNRELSWVLFDERVLDEARDKSNPLMERLKFLSITASNLDEFFMIRVASLRDMVNAGYNKEDIAGMNPQQQLDALDEATHRLVDKQYSTLTRSLMPLMEQEGIHLVLRHEDLNKEQMKYVDDYFMTNVYPVLTPMAVDSSRPFPLIRNKTLNIGALVSKKVKDDKKKNGVEKEFATVQVPSVLPRIIKLPCDEGDSVILLEEIIERNMGKLFANYDVICAYPFRIMRNADLTIEEDEAADLLKEIERQLKKRQWGEVIRLEVADDIDKKLMKVLLKELNCREEAVYRIQGPLDLTFLMKLCGMDGYDNLRDPEFSPQPVEELGPDKDIFAAIRNKDLLLHHPYETFQPIVDFIRQASKDPDVLAIKQTLYRVSGHSPIIAALAQAAENGKQVTVLVELKARFDEENNIIWARMLEKAGCHVIYGLVGLKTHSKITLVVRREDEGIRRYVHLGTGNYNDSTAKLYTDLGLLTCSEPIGEDATAVFNMLSGYSEPLNWNRLSVAPLWLKDRFLALIRREMNNAKQGKNSKIIAKINSLCDKDIIMALYEASMAGVRIDLIIRGICCLRTGIPGISENITVRSIVGRFLEHSRIFYFENAGTPEVYCGSADWMPRNLERRVEILFPIEETDLKERVCHILDIMLRDTLKARIMDEDGEYSRVDKRGKELLGCQAEFCREAVRKTEDNVKKVKGIENNRVFTPETAP